MSAAKWIGFMVSISCKDDMGSYQGQISSATDTTITLTKVFHNGIPRREPEIIHACDIENLQIIDNETRSNLNGQSTVTVAKPVPKRAGRSVSVSECSNINNSSHNSSMRLLTKETPGKANDFSHSQHQNVKVGSTTTTTTTPNKKEKNKKSWKNEECFGSEIENSMLQDFDFEKNLALFNKEELWQKLNASQKPDVVHQTTEQCRKRTQKYRHDENIIATLPTIFRQIIVPAPDTNEYVTDDGLIVPSVTSELRRQLFTTAEDRGLTLERQIELIGRAATEMALQLLGGGHRLSPHNSHQWPTVVLLCGPHSQGAIGINCARQLASHGVNTIVHLTLHDDVPNILNTEYQLYKQTKNKSTVSVAGLPTAPDLIIVALYSTSESDEPKLYPQLAAWTNQNRAPVLALDPPAAGTPGIQTKYSLVPVLPLSYATENGKIYLCNLGFPLKVFSDVGVKYRSPFGPKFVIPLHPNDT